MNCTKENEPRSDSRAFGVAYKITNTLNGKSYIGIAKNPKTRWYNHKRSAQADKPIYLIHRAIAKHGIENFSFEVIASALTIDDLYDTERILIAQHGSHVSGGLGYNATRGGEGIFGHKMSEASRSKMSIAKKGKPGTPLTEEVKKILRESNRNRVISDATKQKLREAKLGTNQTVEHRMSISSALTGKSKSPEHKTKMRASLPLAWAARVAALTGVPRSAETKEKLSRANKGKSPCDEARRLASAAWPKGSKHTEEARMKISEAGRLRVVKEETRRAISAAHTGRVRSDESKAKMSEAQKRRHAREKAERALAA